MDSAYPIADQSARKAGAERRRLLRLKIIFPFLLVLVFITYAYTTNFVPSQSMLPTIQPGDHIVTERSWLAYPHGALPHRGDVVVFLLPANQMEGGSPADPAPADTALETDDENDPATKAPKRDQILIKRVIALPGETVQVIGKTVKIDGKPLVEHYKTLPDMRVAALAYSYAGESPLKVPPGHIFLLGDNRANSDDSRYWGTIPARNVIGKFVCVLFREGANGPNELKARARGDY